MKIVRNNIEIGKWYHGLTMIPQAYCNDKLVFPNIYSDVEEGYDIMCSGTINDYEGTAPEVYVMSVSKWYMRTTGGNYKEYGVYGDNKNDPYVGELVVVDGHEWEYTSSGWVDLGETSGSIYRLPQGYTELEYIQSYDENNIPTFPAIIQTDYYPNYQSKFEFKMQALVNNEFPRFWGAGAWNGYYGLQMDFESYVTGSTRIHALGSSGWSLSSTSGDYNANDYIYDRGKLYKNGELILSTTNASVTASDPMAIFTFHDSAYTQGAGYHVKPAAYLFGRLYYFSIYDNDVLVKQYVPAKRNSDNMVGVYDLVNSEFITAFTDENHSTQFVAGPAITELTLPNVSYSLNYNAKNMDGSKLLKTDGQLVNTDATINGSFTSSEDHITIPSGTNILISGYQTYMNRSNSYPQLTIVSKAVTTLSEAHSLIANRGSNYNWMYRQYQNKLTLHGTSEQGSITLTVDDNPKILSIRVDPERLLRYNNWTEGSVGTTTYSSFSYGSTESTGFSMFRGYYNQTMENWGGDFYWLYVTQKYLSNEQIRQIIAYNEGGTIALPKEYTEMDAPDPIGSGYYTSPDEYLKVSDNYYKKDYVTEIYEGGCEIITTDYVQGDQLTPSYVQGEASDFIVYDGGRYYKNYIYVTPVSTPIATGDYVRGEYIGPADIIISGLTSKSQDFTLRINGKFNSKTATITGTEGDYHTYAWYDDLSQSFSLAYMSYNDGYVNYLKSIHINPDAKITSIQSIADHMSYLENITLPSGLTTIDSLAFASSGLKSLYIPAAVTNINYYAGSPFKYLDSLTDFAVDPNNANFKSETQCLLNKAGTQLIRAFKGYVIPSSVTEIYSQAFSFNGYVTDVVIPDAITTIPSFRECSNLSSVKLSDNSTTMDSWLFVDSPKLSSITLPSGLTSIGNNNFRITSSSTYGRGYEITIPATVTSIGNNCFQKQNCVVHMQSSTPPTLGSSCFVNNYGYIYVPVGSRETYIAASNWSTLADMIVEEGYDFSTMPVTGTATGGTVTMRFGNSNMNGVYYDGDKFFINAPLTATSVGGNAATLNITTIDLSRMTNVTSIGNNTFSENHSLTTAKLPDSLKSINYRGFYDCTALQSITIPSGVTSIGFGAFYNDGNSNTVYICEPVTPPTIDTYVFWQAKGTIYVPDESLTAYKTATNWREWASMIKPISELPSS